ncbi:hypothetical protein A4249_07805 [Brevundimonas sp. GW460-12-10-14-LB2]|uniref:DUF2336 domain-containing protein n=1 Tax=Brevundimonas sp. GW460-12-10-14-LB2 TaxID=1827469 RepID=UPI0007BCD1DD|nr:DUF2336 domain-containing protein [Brevundimonas sp. GW460-12-10-14-LB2]ANC53571.1 hypothetical protein A4249_07805 [Brevundimonas sp. GW460-12-10-14-LB2]
MSVVQLEPPRDAWDDRTVSELMVLASSRSADDRQRLLLKVTSLCESNPPPPKVAPLLSDIFLALTAQAERDIRLALSERIAGVDWAPPALVNMLALDEIEIARPVITSSPLLRNADLIRLLIEATLEHQIAVARRPQLARPVVDTIVDRAEPVTMTALASNRTADIGEDAMRKLVDHSRRIAGLRAPLTRHPRLNEQLAQQLYQWVGQALRQSIGERFRIDDDQLNAAVQDAAAKAVGSPEWRAMSARMTEDRARIDAERRLVEKLQAAGQLRPGLLVRALREQRFELFEQTLAVLGGFSEAQVHHAIRAPTAEPLYLACIAVGVDKAVFASVLVEVRKLSGGMPADGGWKATPMSAHAASRAFHQMMHRPATV